MRFDLAVEQLFGEQLEVSGNDRRELGGGGVISGRLQRRDAFDVSRPEA